MKLTLEQLAMWLGATVEPDLGIRTPEQQAALIAGLSKEALAKYGYTRGQVRQGFLQGINDRISQMEWWSDEDRQKVEVLLADRGLPSLSMMELVVKKKHKRIVARGSIKNDEEYYLVKELLDGPQSIILLVEESKVLWNLRSAYESRARK